MMHLETYLRIITIPENLLNVFSLLHKALTKEAKTIKHGCKKTFEKTGKINMID